MENMRFKLTGEQIDKLADFCGGDLEVVVVVADGDGHSGPGLYAFCDDYPEEGSIYLGPSPD
jgi:hypothetical protein